MSELQVYVQGRLVPAAEAAVSVWDSGFQHGDAVYEGLRVYRSRVFRLHEHIRRLYDCAAALMIDVPMSMEDMAKAVLSTVKANGFTDDTHIRLTVTRGTKRITGMDPHLAATPATVVIIAEPKQPSFPSSGIRLITSSVRRTPAACLDPKLHSCNQLGQILAKIEANNAGADEGLMLDVNGFVAETNSANVFVVKDHRVMTPTRNACMPGLTRGFVLAKSSELGYPSTEEDISLADVYWADEMIVCGTVCEIVPVINVDGRRIGTGQPGPFARRMLEEYLKVATTEGVAVG